MSIMAEGKHKGVKGITVGIDLAGGVFAVHAVDDNGKSPPVKPNVVPKDLAQPPPAPMTEAQGRALLLRRTDYGPR